MDLTWKVHRLRAGAKLPSQAHPGDAGWDLCYCAPEGREDAAPELRSAGGVHWLELPTGLAMAFSPGWVFKIEARSGLAVRHGISVLAGVVDAGYRGEVVVLLRVPAPPPPIHHGERIAQGLFLPVPHVAPEEIASLDALPDSVRGTGGWGSTGRH